MGSSGSANQGIGYGGAAEDGDGKAGQSRREQGYGGGNDVGA